MTDSTTPPDDTVAISITRESDGYVLACGACGWTRYETSRGATDRIAAEHPNTCKPKRAPVERAATAPRSTKWDDREGATWIDRM